MTNSAKGSAEVSARFKKVLFPSVAPYYEEPVALSSGQGMKVVDLDGKSYLDFFGGILTTSLGHSNERVNAAVRAQMLRLGHVSTLYPNVPIVELAEKLVELAPGAIDRAFFCTSGTEADETAVMLAQAYTGRQEILALRHGYSGRTAMGQSLVGSSRYRVVATQVAGVKHGHAPYCYRCPFGLRYPSCELKCAADLEELILTATVGEIAGIIIEPILGVGGVITPPQGWMALAVEIVRRYGGIFICDEVQTGFGRTGAMWGVDHEGLQPEVLTAAKGIANGYPISAVLATTDVAAAWSGGNISTFGGNPISCVAAAATIDAIVEERLVDNARVLGAILREGLDALKEKYAFIGDVRGRGLMLGVELVVDEKSGDRRPAGDAALRVLEETKRRGLLLGRGGFHGNVLRVAPALIASSGDVADALQIMDDAFAAYKASRP